MSIQAALVGNSSQLLSCTLSSTSAYGARRGGGSVSTTGITATPIGGTAPFTYLWTYASGDNTFSANSPTSANTIWTTTLILGQDKDAGWQVVITDLFGNTSPPQFVNITVFEDSFV